MKIVIDNVKFISDDIFQVKLTRDELGIFNKPAYDQGSYSILFVEQKPEYDTLRNSIYVDPLKSMLLNAGSTNYVLIINSEDKERAEMIKSITTGKPLDRLIGVGGDRLFLQKLPKEIKILGKNLLAGVREYYDGELKYYPKSNKFVETPKNFWSVKIQPRAKSLRITIKGETNDFIEYADFTFKNDIRTFSSFILSDINKVKEAANIISLAYSNLI